MANDPTPVEVKNEEPLPVSIHENEDTKSQIDAKAIAALVRSEANILRTANQRLISGMWESTQRLIAIAVVLDVLLVSSIIVLIPPLLLLTGHPVDDAIKAAAVGGLLFLTSTSSLVIGFYFGRTNHERVGGVGEDRYDLMGR